MQRAFFLSSKAIIPLKMYIQYYFIFRLYVFNFQLKCIEIPACSCPRLHNRCGEWESWDPVNRFNHISWWLSLL